MEAEHSRDSVTFRDVYKHLKSITASQLALISKVVHLVKLVLLMPATSAVSKCSASAMHCIKTYLPSSMTQTQLTNAMVVHIHKHLTDSLDYAKVLNEFVSANEDRCAHFGKLKNCVLIRMTFPAMNVILYGVQYISTGSSELTKNSLNTSND